MKRFSDDGKTGKEGGGDDSDLSGDTSTEGIYNTCI